MRYSIGIEETLNTIFSGITVGAVDKDNTLINRIVKEGLINLARFRGTFQHNIFQDEYAVLYALLVDKGINVATVDMIDAIIRNNLDLINDSPYIDVNRMIGLDIVGVEHMPTMQEKSDIIIEVIKDKVKVLSNKYVTEDEFNSSIAIFIDWFKENYMLEVCQNMTLIMSDNGFTERIPGKRSKTWKGSEMAQEYFREKSKEIESLTSRKVTDDVVIDGEWYAEQERLDGKNRNQRLVKVGIKEIDDYLGWLRRGNMLGILGPPKGGKTTLSNYLASRALDEGLNVAVWPVEGTVSEWLSKQIALRIKKDYNISVSSKIILELDFDGVDKDSEKLEVTHGGEITEINKGALRKIVDSAKYRMATDDKLGRLSFIDDALYLETMEEVLENHYRSKNPFDVIIVDSMVNMGSIHKTGGKAETISKGYMNLKRFISKTMKVPALAIAPAQLKQDTVDELRRHPDLTIDDTSGGESAETIRTPDEVIGIFSSKEERMSGMCKLYHVASRHSAYFNDFYCGSDLQCSWFESRPELNDK